MFRSCPSRLWIALLVFLVAFVPRVIGLGTFITWDEPQWAFRAAKFLHALGTRNPAGTFLIGAPGVITMWCGALGMAAQRALSPSTEAAWRQIVAQPSLNLHDVVTLRAIARFLVAAKISLVLLTSLGIAGIYLLTERLLADRYAALLAALLIAFNPYFLAHSRVFHTDAPATIFVVSSLLLLLIAQGEDKDPVSRLYLLSGAAAGLAFLAKASTLPFIGIAGLLLLWPALWPWEGPRQTARSVGRAVGAGLVWLAAAGFAFAVVWPALWTAPVSTLSQMFGLARRFAATPHAQNYFMGQAVRNPGLLFYPASLAFRTTPLTWLGLLAAIAVAVRQPRLRRLILALLAFALLYVLPLAVSAKKFERYALPVYPALDIIAAIGWAALIRRVTAHLPVSGPTRSSAKWVLSAALAAPLLAISVLYYPYYLAWANPLTGGASRAAVVMPTGWGEGIDLAARYLNGLPGAEDLRVAVWGVPGFGPLFRGESLLMSKRALTLADYAVVYIGDVQFHSPYTAQFYESRTPVYTATIQGIPYAWVYANDTYTPTLSALRQKVTTTEALLFDAHTRSARALAGERPASVFTIAGRPGKVAAALNRVGSSFDRLAYVQYDSAPQRGGALRRQLETGALLLGRDDIPLATVWHYRVTEPFAPITPTQPADVDFGGQLRLTATGLRSATLEDRRALGIAFRWQVLSPTASKYHIFIHLLDETGYRWGQWDGPLAEENGDVQAGQVLSSLHLVRPLPGLPPGPYHLEIGLYDPATGQRLAAETGGRPAGTSYRMGPLTGRPPHVPRTPDELTISHPTTWKVPGLRLAGYDAACDENSAARCTLPVVRPGDTVPLTLFWQAETPARPDYELEIQWVGSDHRQAGKAASLIAAYPTGRWPSGGVLRVPLRPAADSALPGGSYTLTLVLQDEASGRVAGSYPLLSVPVQTITHTYTLPPVQQVTTATLGASIRLRGYDLRLVDASSGRLQLTLYWQAQETPRQSYTVFVHLVGPAGNIVSQEDSLPAGGDRPTTGWVSGEIITDRHELPVPAGSRGDSYTLHVGLYQPATGQRLPAYDGRGQRLPDDAITLPAGDLWRSP
ncbi:MAG: phospholipid carrier-dependent glycosyltransferase [Chloroflexi bacterium]|nr:phospholipid carrier-dependent glycosyltransferase [Chloroflexota bacterium]